MWEKQYMKKRQKENGEETQNSINQKTTLIPSLLMKVGQLNIAEVLDKKSSHLQYPRVSNWQFLFMDVQQFSVTLHETSHPHNFTPRRPKGTTYNSTMSRFFKTITALAECRAAYEEGQYAFCLLSLTTKDFASTICIRWHFCSVLMYVRDFAIL